jgi:hypothetical protein
MRFQMSTKTANQSVNTAEKAADSIFVQQNVELLIGSEEILVWFDLSDEFTNEAEADSKRTVVGKIKKPGYKFITGNIEHSIDVGLTKPKGKSLKGLPDTDWQTPEGITGYDEAGNVVKQFHGFDFKFEKGRLALRIKRSGLGLSGSGATVTLASSRSRFGMALPHELNLVLNAWRKPSGVEEIRKSVELSVANKANPKKIASSASKTTNASNDQERIKAVTRKMTQLGMSMGWSDEAIDKAVDAALAM